VKIIQFETLRPACQPNVLLLQLHTDEGMSGLGESFYSAAAVEAYLHETVAPVVLAMTDPAPEAVARKLSPYTGYQGAGVETRGNGAVDIALWDLLGKRAGLPVVELLGGRVRDQIEIYNTCAGSGYVSTSSRQESANWGRTDHQPYEDLHAFLTDPGMLARELLAEGVRGMKIWPFDEAAEQNGGTYISPRDLARGVALVEQVREAVGDDIELMIELHSLWNLPAATTICHALSPYRPYWVEDPLCADGAGALGKLASNVDMPIAAGETCVGRRGFLPLLEHAAIDVATVDVQWTGGLTEARKVAALCDAFGIPIAPHDCTGPVSLAAGVHLVLSQPNGLIQETVRSFMRTWYTELVEGLPPIRNGAIRLTGAPGLGVNLRKELAGGVGARRRVTHAEDVTPPPQAPTPAELGNDDDSQPSAPSVVVSSPPAERPPKFRSRPNLEAGDSVPPSGVRQRER
jgi:L-alanine-DL-glutamate epimerase-like enolase superfamily enzyme